MSDTGQTAAIPELPPLGISTALLTAEVPAPGTNGELAPWIKVTPRGPAQTRDGRRYSFTPETLVARFKADGIDVAADLDHALALRATKGDATHAIGWAKELQARTDGTYARMEWLDSGKAALSTRSHRYVSPTFHHDDAGEATWLHSISLVAAPALRMPALAAAGTGAAAPTTVPEALGLDPSADEAACLAAIGELRDAFVPVGLFSDAVAALNAANGTLAKHLSEARAARVQALIEGALKSLKIVPAQRAQYEALCRTDAGLTHVATLFANTVPGLAPSGISGHPHDRGDGEMPDALAARANRYREDEARGGRAVTHAEAIRFVHENPNVGR